MTAADDRYGDQGEAHHLRPGQASRAALWNLETARKKLSAALDACLVQLDGGLQISMNVGTRNLEHLQIEKGYIHIRRLYDVCVVPRQAGWVAVRSRPDARRVTAVSKQGATAQTALPAGSIRSEFLNTSKKAAPESQLL